MFVIKHFKDLSVDEFFEIAKARYEVFACPPVGAAYLYGRHRQTGE